MKIWVRGPLDGELDRFDEHIKRNAIYVFCTGKNKPSLNKTRARLKRKSSPKNRSNDTPYIQEFPMSWAIGRLMKLSCPRCTTSIHYPTPYTRFPLTQSPHAPNTTSPSRHVVLYSAIPIQHHLIVLIHRILTPLNRLRRHRASRLFHVL